MANQEEIKDTATEEETKPLEQEEPKAEEISEEGKKEKKSRAEKKLQNEIEALKATIEEQSAELAEKNDTYLRVLAEYDNFRKRSKAEREGVYADAYADAIKELLPILDNIERATAFTDGEQVIEGVKMTAKAFGDALEKMGVSEIECKEFDPNLHNAVMHIEDDTLGDGEIVEVFQKGYKKGDKVIRYAMVKTAN